MDKHTFQVGDRVVDTIDKSKGTIQGKNQHSHWLVLRDDGLCGGWRPYFSYINDHLAHDTDFQVGDWVRYEQTHKTVGTPKAHGQIGKIERMGDHPTVSFPSVRTEFLLENLVKIQPPREEKKMVIKRKHVDNVVNHNVRPSVISYDGGSIDGFYQSSTGKFFPASEWEPVEEWVKIEVRKSQWDHVCNVCGVLEVQKKSDTYPDTCTLSWRYPK